MTKVTVKTPGGADSGEVELDESIFGIKPNIPVMHQVVTAQLAARRAGSHSTRTRAERSGGGSKPWRQKGTGRARQGSIRSPQWRGGGVALGPKPRDYSQRTPKKMKALALRSALSDRAAEGRVMVVDGWGFEVPRTKDARAALDALEVEGTALVVLAGDDVTTWKSFRNLPRVRLIESDQLNAYDVLVSDWVIFSRGTLPGAGEESGPVVSKASTAESAEAATTEAGPVAAPAKKTVKKVVKKKVVKKVVKKRAPAAASSDEDAEGRGPRMKPAGSSEGGEA